MKGGWWGGGTWSHLFQLHTSLSESLGPWPSEPTPLVGRLDGRLVYHVQTVYSL